MQRLLVLVRVCGVEMVVMVRGVIVMLCASMRMCVRLRCRCVLHVISVWA